MHFKSISLAIFLILSTNPVNAELRHCQKDKELCPSGENLHCVSYGWCGNQCEDSCDGVPRDPKKERDIPAPQSHDKKEEW